MFSEPGNGLKHLYLKHLRKDIVFIWKNFVKQNFPQFILWKLYFISNSIKEATLRCWKIAKVLRFIFLILKALSMKVCFPGCLKLWATFLLLQRVFLQEQIACDVFYATIKLLLHISKIIFIKFYLGDNYVGRCWLWLWHLHFRTCFHFSHAGEYMKEDAEKRWVRCLYEKHSS